MLPLWWKTRCLFHVFPNSTRPSLCRSISPKVFELKLRIFFKADSEPHNIFDIALRFGGVIVSERGVILISKVVYKVDDIRFLVSRIQTALDE